MEAVARKQFTLEELELVFDAQERLGHPCVLMGGQAVCLWVQRYLDSEPALKQMSEAYPFLSKDIDFQGTVAAAQRLAKLLDCRLEVADLRRDFGNLMAGKLTVWLGADALAIEILRKVPGLETKELEWLTVLERSGSRSVRVLNPVGVLAAKAWNVAHIHKEGRHDIEQLFAATVCVRRFLRDLLGLAQDDTTIVRPVLNLLQRVLLLAESRCGEAVTKRCGLDWSWSLPWLSLAKADSASIGNLRERRLPQWRRHIGQYSFSGTLGREQSALREICRASAEPAHSELP